MFKNTQDFNTMKLKIKNKRFNITKLWSINNSFLVMQRMLGVTLLIPLIILFIEQDNFLSKKPFLNNKKLKMEYITKWNNREKYNQFQK